MYIVDGIAYAGEVTAEIEVESIKVLEDMVMIVTFSTVPEQLCL